MGVSIKSFKGPYRFLSNFYHVDILYENLVYPSSEHAYQAAKTLDSTTRLRIANLQTPAHAKRKGKELQLRDGWSGMRLQVMEDVLRIKFSNPRLRELLLETWDSELVEGNWWHDTYWGICNGVGENNFGKLLMKIRGEL